MTLPAPPAALAPLPEAVAREGGARHVLRAVEYAVPEGHRPLLADVHLPVGARRPPVVLFLHGGGWRLGSRAVFVPTWRDWEPDPFARLTTAGFAVVSVDYRLTGEAVFPAQLDDAAAALAWVRARADDLGVDGDRVVVWGESAGGHLAALLGLTSPAGGGVRAVVDWYGPADLTTMAEQARPDAVADPDAEGSREALLLGGRPSAVREAAIAASPVARVHPGAPPFLLAHGDADRFVPVGQSRQLAAALEGVGARVELDVVPGADHLWRGAPDPEAVFERALAFAREAVSARAGEAVP